MTARPQVELPVVCHGMRRKGESAVIGVIPNKVATNEPKREEYLRDFEEVPLVLASDYAALTTRLAESEARAEGDARRLEKIMRDMQSVDLHQLTGTLTPTIAQFRAAIDAAIAQEAEREAASAATRC